MSKKKKSRHYYPQSTTKKSKFDIFNGNVNNPGEFVFIYSLIGVMCIATLIFFAVCSAPRSHDDLQYTNLQFSRYEIHDEHLYLYIDGSDKYYSIPAYQETITNPEEFLSLCEDNATLHVGYVDYPKADNPHFGLESIQDMNGTVYLTMEAIHEYRWGEAPAFYAVFGGITVMWFIVVIISVYIGRHPEQFSRRTIKLFFKDGAIRRYKNR